MNQEDHKQIVAEEEAGTLLIGVDRPTARKLFTDKPLRTITEEIGEPLYLEKAIVLSSFTLGFVLLWAAVILSVWAWHWWAILIGPITFVIWFSYLSESSRGTSGIGSALIAVGVVAGIYLFTDVLLAKKLWLLAAGGSLFFTRFTYSVSTYLVRLLVIRNWRAFAMLEGKGISLRRVS